MGTRSTTKFIEKRGDKKVELVNIYQQWDGYVSGKGYDLANFLKSKKIINGIGSGQDTFDYANGFGCLIAQYIKEFKENVGNLYITDLDDSQEYNYQVIFDGDKYYNEGFLSNKVFDADELITIEVDSYPTFEGTPSELLEFKEGDEDDE